MEGACRVLTQRINDEANWRRQMLPCEQLGSHRYSIKECSRNTVLVYLQAWVPRSADCCAAHLPYCGADIDECHHLASMQLRFYYDAIKVGD